MNPSLQRDIRQLSAYGILSRLDRMADANVAFTFDAADIYISAFHEAMEHLETVGFIAHDPELVQLARVFEQFTTLSIPGISRFQAGLISASLYWLSGYSANALVLSRALSYDQPEPSTSVSLLLKLFGRKFDPQTSDQDRILEELIQYLKTGDESSLADTKNAIKVIESNSLSNGDVNEYVTARLAGFVLQRLGSISLWTSIANRSSAPHSAWVDYVANQIKLGRFITDLWPSQRDAIAKGLLDGRSSLVISTPTSSGKTKMTEFAFVNDLYSDQSCRCLYLAPFRALVGEIENDIGLTFTGMNFSVASLYGGSDANELEVELANRAHITIATPEKIAAVLNLSGGNLSEYKTIVLDEGHLLNSISRGTSYEFQLAGLRSKLMEENRVIFLSAVLPNSDELALWLGGTLDRLSSDEWQPTSVRIGAVTWSKRGLPRLDYRAEAGQHLTDEFFVPRLFVQDQWKEINKATRRTRQRVFPQHDNKSIAACLAFQYVKSGPVIIYANRPDWVDSIGKTIVDRLSSARPIETNLIDENNREALAELATYFRRRLGDALLTEAISNGFALHHGRVPQRLRTIIEDAYRKQIIRLIIATNTIAEGVNFPAKTVIVHSLPQSDAPVRDFWNLVGRAGRANRETDGEVLILKTGTLKENVLRRFLDKRRMESVESRILLFVRDLLNRYPIVSEETIDALLAGVGLNHSWNDLLRTIDTHLLESLAEDLAASENDPSFENLVDNLLATYQASKRDQQSGTRLETGVRSLLAARRRRILERIPDGARRKRYARVGLSIDSALAIEEIWNELRSLATESITLDDRVFQLIVRMACKCTELSEYESDLVGRLGYIWIKSSDYKSVFSQGQGIFRNLDQAISFVEEVLCYRLPWVINGLVRSLEQNTDGSAIESPIPEWIRLLPQFLQYGVDSKELVWVHSLGIQEPDFAEFILNKCVDFLHDRPSTFRELLVCLLDNAPDIEIEVQSQWPNYFRQSLREIVTRYTQLRRQLSY